MAITDLTPELLRETLSYEPETGIFTWVRGRHGRRIGEQAGSLHSSGYIYVGAQGKKYSAHRLAWFFMTGKWPVAQIDHINGNRADNRIENLRDVSMGINMQNMRKAQVNNKSSGLLGVRKSSHTQGKWLAEIWVDGRRKHIGVFSNPECAHEAYLNEKRKIHPGCVI
jgi:hypothetical protein